MREWLRTLRKQKGLSQKEAAKKFGVSQQYYSMIEQKSRQKNLELSLIRKISNVFDVSVNYIINKEEERQETHRSCDETLETVRGNIQEDSNGVHSRFEESVLNISPM